tara:strand:- start:193 stop:1194 length:1002 start_codon:yes stop_codon:yes gene_type:complete
MELDNTTYIVGLGIEFGIGVGLQGELGLVRFPDGQWELFYSVGGGLVTSAALEAFGGASGSVALNDQTTIANLVELPGMSRSEFYGVSFEASAAFPVFGPVHLGGEIEIPLFPNGVENYTDLFFPRNIPDGTSTHEFSVVASAGVGAGIALTFNYTGNAVDLPDDLKSFTVEYAGPLIGELRDLILEQTGEDIFEKSPRLKELLETGHCFSAGTLIDMADGSQKPIEQIEVGDEVLSYDPAELGGLGDLKPARVTRTMVNQVEEIIDFHGVKMTPGHATLVGEGPHQGQHIPIMDILVADGAIVNREGELIRAATNLPVGSEGDRFVQGGLRR